MTQRLGDYELLAEIGRGGVGVVYRARGPDGADVAVKLVLRQDAGARTRFDRERRLLASLGEAEGFVPFLAAGEAPQGPFLVMPFLGGGTLRERLRRGPLGVGETLALGRRLAVTLGLAHARGLVHRDLKPENILFAPDGRPLVADLGLAKHFVPDAPGASQSQALSRTGELRGTVGYMAPEQAVSAKDAQPAADVFALGAILYECLAGQPAFLAASALQLLDLSAQGSFTPLAELRPETPAWLAAAIERALAPDPARRPADGAALARALAGPPLPGRERSLRAALAGAAALALVAGGVALLRGRATDPAAAPTPAPPPVAPPSAAPDGAALARRGGERLRAGDLAGALADLDSAIAAGPVEVRAWIDRADARARSGDLAGAIADASRALELDPGRARAWALRGLARLHGGDPRGAFEDAGRAIELAPGHGPAWALRARLRIDRGEWEESVRDATQAIELDERLGLAWESRAAARAFLGRSAAEVVPDADRAIALAAQPPTLAWWARGESRLRAGELEGAIEDLSRAVVPGSGFVLPLMTRATACLQAGDLDRAIDDATRALESAPTVVLGCWLTRGRARQLKGDREGARADYERFLELNPSSPAARQVRAWIAELR